MNRILFNNWINLKLGKLNYLIPLFLVCGFSGKAQELTRTILATDSEYFKNDIEGNIHFSIGEAIVNWLEEDALILSQGFQQLDLEDISYQDDFDLFNLFPNPNNGVFELNIGISNQAKIEVEAYNAIGQLIYRNRYNDLLNGENKIRIELPQKVAGVYFLSFIVNGKRLYAQEFENGPFEQRRLKYYQYLKFIVMP